MRTESYFKISIFVILLLAFTSCKKQEKKTAPPVIRPVRTIVVGAIDTGRERSFSGVAKAAVETRLSFRVGGEVDKLPAKIGMKLKKGDLIARLDPTDYELSVKQAQANLAQAQAQYTRAKSEYDRDRQLYEAGNISRSQLDRSLAAYKSGRAQTDAARKSVQLAKQQLKYTVLNAPLDGSIASIPIESHQTVAPGQTIATLTSGGELEMAIGIPESLIAQIHVKDMARINFDAIPNKDFKARVIEVGVEASETTTYPVKLQIMGKYENLRSGMVGQAILNFEAATNFITIPLVAVAASSKGEKYVWVFTPDKPGSNKIVSGKGKVIRRAVSIGALTSNGLQVLKGLEPGEIIAVRGVHRLIQDMKVRNLPLTDAAKALTRGQEK
ncbi:efflux RND transporter periplasmic adaptor subunit [Desulfobacterales bacterium HSG17]|nr:efflux RND transporter periplasmic adaptor subunit [Desulfobacterales bacterium HSG17]